MNTGRYNGAGLLSCCCYIALGICLFAAPWAMLLFSDKSPLRSQDAAYINGFGLGIGFAFFMLVGVWFFVGAIAIYRRRLRDR